VKGVVRKEMEMNDSKSGNNRENASTRLGCRELENYTSLNYSNEQFTFGFCCPRPGQPKTPKVFMPMGDMEEMADAFRVGRADLVATLGRDPHHPCEGCSKIECMSADPGFKPLKTLQLSLPLPCNIKCFYCHNTVPKRPRCLSDALKSIDEFDFVALFEAFEKKELADAGTKFNWASGEIAVYKYKERFFEFALSHVVAILTNAVLYEPALAKWFASGQNKGILNVSLDCGTRDTFQRIKRLDAYDRVCENLIKYGEGRNQTKSFELKYIICEGINDNEADIDGFFEIAHVAKATLVLLDRDFHNIQKPLNEHTLKMCARFYRNAQKSNIRTIIRQQFSDEVIECMKAMSEDI
jgi:wyosine [tRNA(Phe)-imidazoG37] synthetase (radical SAM superfamily)